MPAEHIAPKTKPGRKFRLVDDSDESWREFGRNDPYFGVISVDRYRSGNLNQAMLDEFFAGGEWHVANLLGIIQTHLGDLPQTGDALDFGCGVGRLVLPLASRFRNVVGVDISDAYIAEAMRNCDRKGLTNVQFAENLESLSAEGRKFDLVHSYIVFNHIPWARGKIIIGQMFDLLKDKGVMALHVLHRRKTGLLRRAISRARRNFLPFHWVINLARGRRAFEPLMQANEYPLDELLPLLRGLGAENFHVRIEPATGGESFAFIFCEKAAKG